MDASSSVHQMKYILWIRSEYKLLSNPLFYGMLETISGQKFEFSTLAELNGLLCEIGGWIDTPPLANGGSEPNEMCTATGVKGC